jgi:hypothetical protein
VEEVSVVSSLDDISIICYLKLCALLAIKVVEWRDIKKVSR